MRTIDVITLGTKCRGAARTKAVDLGVDGARRQGRELPAGTRVRVRLRRPVEVAGGRGVAFVPYFAETVYT